MKSIFYGIEKEKDLCITYVHLDRFVDVLNKHRTSPIQLNLFIQQLESDIENNYSNYIARRLKTVKQKSFLIEMDLKIDLNVGDKVAIYKDFGAITAKCYDTNTNTMIYLTDISIIREKTDEEIEELRTQLVKEVESILKRNKCDIDSLYTSKKRADEDLKRRLLDWDYKRNDDFQRTRSKKKGFLSRLFGWGE